MESITLQMFKTMLGSDQARKERAIIIEIFSFAVVNFLLFLFFVIITVIVVKKEAKIDKTILSMLICLQLCCLSGIAYDVIYGTFVHEKQHSIYTNKLFKCLISTLENLRLLFLELAILLNINKWIYFILALKAHRNICHYDISIKIFA